MLCDCGLGGYGIQSSCGEEWSVCSSGAALAACLCLPFDLINLLLALMQPSEATTVVAIVMIAASLSSRADLRVIALLASDVATRPSVHSRSDKSLHLSSFRASVLAHDPVSSLLHRLLSS